MELVIAPEPKAAARPGHSRRVAGRGALVDVVRLAGRPRHLLDEVVLLVRAAAGAEDSDAVRAVLVADFRQPLSGERQGLCPRRLAEGAVFADQRPGEPLGRMNELEPEAALDAGVAVVGHAARLGRDPHDAIGLGVDAADRAGNRRRNKGRWCALSSGPWRGRGPTPRAPTSRRWGRCSRTGRKSRRSIRSAAGRTPCSLVRPARALERERLGHLHLGADSHAALAADALRGVVDDPLVADGVDALPPPPASPREPLLGGAVLVAQ